MSFEIFNTKTSIYNTKTKKNAALLFGSIFTYQNYGVIGQFYGVVFVGKLACVVGYEAVQPPRSPGLSV